MKTLPTLEETIRARAEANLKMDIEDASNDFKNFLSERKNLFRRSVQLQFFDGINKWFPYLSQIFDSEFVINKIKENNLGEYIQREIDSILKSATK